MRLVTRLRLAGLLSLVLLLLILAASVSGTLLMRRELARNEHAGAVLQAVTELRYLMLEYALHHQPRTLAQWRLRNTSLDAMLDEPAAFAGSADAQLVNGLERGRQQVDDLFDQLVSNFAGGGASPVRAERESRLSGQISNKTEVMIATAQLLSEHSREGVGRAQQRASLALALAAASILLLLGMVTLMTRRHVLAPLRQLGAATHRIGAGQLDTSVGLASEDEIGDLARAFDRMTARLRNTTVSRDELVRSNEALQHEAAVRQLAERKVQEQLGRLHLLQHITRAIGERLDLRSIFQVVIRSIEEQLPLDFCCICRLEGGRLSVTCVGRASAGLAEQFALSEYSQLAIDNNGMSHCLKGELVYEPSLASLTAPLARRLAGGALQALVMAPLMAEDTVFGVLLAARRQAASFSSGECEFLRQLGEHVGLAAHHAQLYAALQRAYDDIRQSQSSLMQQERLRALGQMASGIAHDINNAISPVALYTETLLETEPGLSERARASLEVIQRAIDDVAATVARMREFYRQPEQPTRLAGLDANALIGQTLELTRARWSDMPLQRGHVIRTVLELAPDLPRLLGVEGEIREALTNLIFNAVDAMPEGGTLTLRSALRPAEADNGAQVLIEVGDDGAGMDEATRLRCLEPFYTTKGERGSGLGLAMVYGMTERHGASIELDTAPGRGCRVRLGFQVEMPGAAAAAAQAPVAISSGRRILVVDDDPLVLKSLGDILAIDGHAVTAADGGVAGLACFDAAQAGPQPFELVISDLGMPYVDGRKLAAAVKLAAPATPVILLTGWGQHLPGGEGECPHVDAVLSKPPKLRVLRAALARLLAPRDGAAS